MMQTKSEMQKFWKNQLQLKKELSQREQEAAEILQNKVFA